jgi:hypothetical protein
MIQKLRYLEAISFIDEVRTDGHSPLLVLTNDYNSYYIKNSKGKTPATYLINEFVCNYLLKLWGLKSPEIAAITVNSDILPETLSNYHKIYFYEQTTFGSKKLEGTVEMNEFMEIDKKTDFNKFSQPIDILKLCLFDIWVENDDRKPTNPNILFDLSGEKIGIVAIDNAFTFLSVDYDQLDPAFGVCQSFNDNLLYSDFAKDIYKYIVKESNIIDYIKDYFYLCIDRCKENYYEIIENIPVDLGFKQELQEALFNFLFDEKRNKSVLTEFYSRL